MMDIFDLLSHGFIQRALIAGSFIAVLCSTLGVFLVLRRLSLIGDGLAHVTFGSVAVGLFMRSSPFYVAIPIVMLGGLGILKLMEKARLYGDAAIGIVSSIGIAAGIFGPAAVAFRHDHAGHQAVEEIAIMADQDHRTRIIADNVFENVERLHVEIVGRLVEHQQIRGPRQCLRQHQPAALAAGELGQGRARLLGGK